MLLTKNPSEEKVQQLIEHSEHKYAKWLKDLEGGDLYYWPASWTTHSQMAGKLQIKDYEKGVVT